jgi:uncharacterized protein YgbK (DUF1537 family)
LSPRWLILADDLTGAADAAVAFARRGYDTAVTWGTSSFPSCDVQALDLDSRNSSAADAAARHGEALRRRLTPGPVFKKIDSTLRGQPAAEIAAICAQLRESGGASWGLLAPANPAMRRTTREARVYVDGHRLEHTETWQREHSYPQADLAAIMASVGLRAIKLPLAVLRGESLALRAALAAATASGQESDTILVCDAETDQDLARLAAAAVGDVAPGFFVGTAGLANALARGLPPGRAKPLTLAPSRRGTLIAVGTLAQVSRTAAQRLGAREAGSLVRIDAPNPAPDPLSERLARGADTVALLDAPVTGGAVDAAYARAFAAALAPALEHMGGLIVTGGETAAAVLARCKVHGIRLLDEIEPGVALGMTRGEIEIPIVTKPGAFGDEETLVRCLDRLNQLRRSS